MSPNHADGAPWGRKMGLPISDLYATIAPLSPSERPLKPARRLTYNSLAGQAISFNCLFIKLLSGIDQL
jgi:hypothetical protein